MKKYNFNFVGFLLYIYILIIVYLESYRCQFYYSDQVPFAYFEQPIQLKQYAGPNPLSYTLNYTAKKFSNLPQIILGIVFYDNYWNPPNGISFQLSAQSVTSQTAVVYVNEENPSQYSLNGIQISAGAIDTSQFPYLNILYLQQLNLQPLTGTSTILFQEVRGYSSNISNMIGTKSAVVFLSGWKSAGFISSNSRFTLSISIQEITDVSYKLQINSNSLSQQIVNVYYTIVEYVSVPINSPYQLYSNQDQQYTVATYQYKCFYDTTCGNSSRYFAVPFQLSPQVVLLTNPQFNITASINQFDFQTIQNEQNPRIQLIYFSSQASRIQYYYYIWDGSTCSGATSSILFFIGKYCNNQRYQLNGQCYLTKPFNSYCDSYNNCSSCSDLNCSACTNPLSQPQLCINCKDPSYYLYNGKCLSPSSIPSKTFCDSNLHQCFDCNQSSCNKCLSDLNTCTDCTPSYLFNGQCSVVQPDNTYCDPSTFQCIKCSDSGCKTCTLSNSSSVSLCSSCYSSQYLLDGKCYLTQPNNTFCDSDNNCTLCTDLNCQICTDPNISSSCVTCITSFYFLNGVCSSSQPTNTFCNTENICSLCSDLNCKTCTDPSSGSQLCLACTDPTYYFYKGQCFSPSSLPSKAFCDSNHHECFGCNQTTCNKCLSDLNTCTDCIPSFLLNGLCSTNQPDNTYCDPSSLSCINCADPDCRTCTQQNPPLVSICTTCFQSDYLLDGKCYSTQPDNTFCNTQNICSQCLDVNCQTCTDPSNSPQLCLTCLNTTYYFYNGLCYSPNNLPSNTFCDSNTLLCVSCNQITCMKCSPDINTCIDCGDQYLFNGQCFENQPNNTYCHPTTRICKQCLNADCATCTDPGLSPSYCVSCPQLYYMLNGVCSQKQRNNTYCDSNKICSLCSDSNCKICTDPSIQPQICVSCQDSTNYLYGGQCYSSSNQPPNTYCNQPTIQNGTLIQSICEQCTNPLCNKCESDLVSCITCIDTVNLSLGANSQCSCAQAENYYNLQSQACLKCNILYCQECAVDGMSCKQCKEGFYQRNQTNIQTCRYCGNGFYADKDNNCANSCMKGCDICKDGQNCVSYIDGFVFQNSECHYSCSQCSIPDEFYSCLKCSSTTREFDEITQSCPCKKDYIDSGQSECILENSNYKGYNFQASSQILIQITYMMCLPQLLINIHPFSDSFIFSMQQLGNLYFINPNSTVIPYQSLTSMNFFNIYYETSSQNNNTIVKVLGIQYKTIIDTQVSQNLIILGIFLTVFSSFSLIIYIFKLKMFNKIITNNLLWNCQMKLIRISSNYLLINIFMNLYNFQKISLISSIVLGILIGIYVLSNLITYKKCKEPDPEKFKYLYDNLNIQQTFHRYFWLILEIKKFVLVCCLSFTPIKFYPYVMVGTTFIFTIMLVKYKPSTDCLRDSIFLILGELFMLVLSLLPIIIEQQNDEIQQLQMLNYSNITLIAYIVFQMIISLEYRIRQLLINRQQQSMQRSKQKTQQPIVMDGSTIELNFENIDDFLNNTSKFQEAFKKQVTVKKITKSTNNYF